MRQFWLDKSKNELRTTESILEDTRLTWYGDWSAYQSRLRLLKLDVEEATLAIESPTAQNEQVRRKGDPGFASIGEAQKSASKLTAARSDLLRAEEMLKLYADIETQQPDLNPDSFKAEKKVPLGERHFATCRLLIQSHSTSCS